MSRLNSKFAIKCLESTSTLSYDCPSELGKLTVFTKFGYTIKSEIGSGNYAKVKLAHSNDQNGSVALKIIRKRNASELFLNDFLPREIDLVKCLHHENIIQYYQCIETNKRVIIAMEYAENGTVLKYLKDFKRFSECMARTYFRQLISALKYCHSKNIAHRDLKLENLLLDRNYVLKLSDFGFARSIAINTSGKHSSNVCLSKTFCGSNAYASPEILQQIPYDPISSDIWATGVILFAMIFGRLPFDDRSLPILLKRVKSGLILPSEPPISEECKNIIKKLMAPLSDRITTQHIKNEKWMNV